MHTTTDVKVVRVSVGYPLWVNYVISAEGVEIGWAADRNEAEVCAEELRTKPHVLRAILATEDK